METYSFYPPQLRSRQVPYHVLAQGTEGCQHQLLENNWQDRISVEDSVLFIAFTCRHCGRQICQSLDEVLPPASWNGGDG